MENFFSSKMKQKTNQELISIIENKTKYDEKALYAATQELENRNIEDKVLPENFKKKLEKKIQADQKSEETNSKLTSKNTIYILSILLTPILIGPFMAFNIWEGGDKKGILPSLGFTLIYMILVLVIYNLLKSRDALPFILFTFNALATILMIEGLWKKYITNYQEKA